MLCRCKTDHIDWDDKEADCVIQSSGVKWPMSPSEIRVTLTRTENPGINLTRQMFRKTVRPLTNIIINENK